LLGIRDSNQTTLQHEEDVQEIKLLSKTLGLSVLEVVYHNIRKINASTFLSKEKANQIIDQAKALECDNIIINAEISPSQMRNLQNLAGYEIRILDRTGIIIDIFSVHAKTAEAKTQVSLAKLEYMLPRLTKQWSHLERQMGGTGTRGGPGEQQIEIDRRLIRRDINKLQKDLKKIQKTRLIQNMNRSNAFQVSLVGYTNAGKSTLMNLLTNADVSVKNELFATLDSTTRRLDLKINRKALISDTVGFIQKLPHELVASFRSTLSDIENSTLILKVIDSNYTNINMHISTIEETIKGIDCKDIPACYVFNKIDLINNEQLKVLMKRFPRSIFTSGSKEIGVDKLKTFIAEAASKNYINKTLIVNYSNLKILDEIYNTVDIFDRKDLEEHIIIKAKGSKESFNKLLAKLKT